MTKNGRPKPARGKLPGRLARIRSVLRHARAIQHETGKSVGAQLAEVVRLRLGPGRLTPLNYFKYGLYDDRRFSWDVKREFIDWDIYRLGGRVNDVEWRAVANDKLAFYAFLRGNGIRHPEVIAFYHPGGRRAGVARCLRTPEEVAAFLRAEMPYPFFGKPVTANYGSGASLVEAYDPAADRLRLADGEAIEVERYVREFVQTRSVSRALGGRSGYIFQHVVRPAPSLEPLIGRYVSTLRVQVLLHDDGPRIHRVMWRVPAGDNITDNFNGGKQGNLLAITDRDTGVVRRVLAGHGAAFSPEDLPGPGSPVERHPNTGAQLVGVRVPEWDAGLALALETARAFPRIRYQSWDIALAAGGPVVLELNYYGDYFQFGQDRGMNDPEMQAFLEQYGT